MLHVIRRTLPTVGVLLVAASAPLDAQPVEVVPGTRIRVQSSALAGRVDGVVISRTVDSVAFTRPGAPPVSVPWTSITQLDVYRGKSRSRGALRGVIWGGGIGAVMGLIPASDAECAQDPGLVGCGSTGAAMVQMALGGAAMGALIGALIGVQDWAPLTMPTRTALVVVPQRAGAGIGMRVGLGVQR